MSNLCSPIENTYRRRRCSVCKPWLTSRCDCAKVFAESVARVKKALPPRLRPRCLAVRTTGAGHYESPPCGHDLQSAVEGRTDDFGPEPLLTSIGRTRSSPGAIATS